MFVGFLYELRRRKVPVGAQEALALARALEVGLHDSSLDGFYDVARALCVHTEAHLDAFDQAFLAHFKGIEEKGEALAEELLQWLRDAAAKPPGPAPPRSRRPWTRSTRLRCRPSSSAGCASSASDMTAGTGGSAPAERPPSGTR